MKTTDKLESLFKARLTELELIKSNILDFVNESRRIVSQDENAPVLLVTVLEMISIDKSRLDAIDSEIEACESVLKKIHGGLDND